MEEVHVVVTSWTGETRVENQPGYIYILYVALYLLPLLYGDNDFMIQLGKDELNS